MKTFINNLKNNVNRNHMIAVLAFAVHYHSFILHNKYVLNDLQIHVVERFS